MYKEFFELVESVENLNEKGHRINKLKEDDDNWDLKKLYNY